MADETKTVVLDFKIDRGSASAEAARLKKELTEIKQEQADLNKQFKLGEIDINNFAKRSSELDQKLKVTNQNYTNLTKSITGTKSSFDKLLEAQTAGGKSLSGLTAEFGKFLTPVGAASAAVGALVGLYSRSTVGAKDLEFAHSQLDNALQLVANDFGKLISSGEDGEGFFTRLINKVTDSKSVLANFAATISPLTGFFSGYIKDAKKLALAAQELEDLGRQEVKVRGDISDRLEENAELQSKIADSATKYVDKVKYQEQIIDNLKKNQEDIVAVKQQELDKLTEIANKDKDSEAKEEARLQAEQALSRERTKAERQIQGQIRILDNINDTEGKRLKILQDQNSERDREIRINKLANERKGKADFEKGGLAGLAGENLNELSDATSTKVPKIAITNQQIADSQEVLAESTKNLSAQSANYAKQKQKELTTLLAYSAGLNVLMGATQEGTVAYKAIASARTIIDTYVAATAALAPPPEGLGPVIGPFLAATTIAAGLANLAKINGAQFAEGGWTGSGNKFDVAGVVHRDEYVVPKSINNSPQAQPYLGALEAMRLRGYADGGNVAAAQSRFMSTLNMPDINPKVSVVEIVEETRRYNSKVNVATA